MSDPMKIISEVTGILESVPESKLILEELKEGKVGPQEATRRIFEIMMGAGHADSLSRAYEDIKDSFREDNPRVWMDHSNGSRIVNPVMVASIMERASLDGDVPEFRVGPIPVDGSPAVPVITLSMNSVKIGMQLEIASEMVESRIEEAVISHRRLLESINEQVAEDPDSPASISLMKALPPVPTGVEGYECGKKAEPISVRSISALELAGTSHDSMRYYTYKTISTTQGRISSALSMRSNLVMVLKEMGVTVSEEELPRSEVLQWAVNCWGPEEINPDWNPVSTAFNKWCSFLKDTCKEGETVSLKVVPVNDIPDRKFGWNLILGKKG